MPSEPNEPQLTHLDEKGAARMVEVGAKAVTLRRAVAVGETRMSEAAFLALAGGGLPKGDALAVARIAGIQGAKKTSDLIPLCHPLPLTGIKVEFELIESERLARVRAEVTCEGKTGVEMEALTAVSAACLALYDMLKAVDKGIVIGPIRLLEKSGGKSGDWIASSQSPPLMP